MRRPAIGAFFVFFDEFAVGVEESIGIVFEEDGAGVAAELDVDAAQRLVRRRPTDTFPNERAAAVEIGDDVARVGSLLVVVVTKLAADRGNFGWVVDAEGPAADV